MKETHIPIRTTLLVYVALLLLLVITTAVAAINLGPFAAVVSVGIASLKALLIILFFMHVKASSSLVKLFAAAGFVWLVILFLLTMSDYLARGIYGG